MGGDERTRRRWALVVAHRETLVRVARSRGLSADEAEDCAQEALARAVAFPALDEERALPFLVATTARLAADRGRERTRAARLAARLAGWQSSEPPPDDDVCDRAVARQFAARLARLPERQRTALLAQASGLTHADIARLLGSTVKGVESLLGRARVELRRTVAFGVAPLAALWRHKRLAAGSVAAPVAVAFVLALRSTAPAPPAGPPPALDPYVSVTAAHTPKPAPQPAVRRTSPPAARATQQAPHRPPTTSPPWSESCVAPSSETGVPYDICPKEPEPTYATDCVVYGPDLSQGFWCGSPTPTEEDP
jgi:RNA polymerase sigma-70 factor (ECF subfamily)